jgi:hypothetical protein
LVFYKEHLAMAYPYRNNNGSEKHPLVDSNEESDDEARGPTITWCEEGSNENETVEEPETVGDDETDEQLCLDSLLCDPQDPHTVDEPEERLILELQQQLESICRRSEHGRSTLCASARRLELTGERKDSKIAKLTRTLDDEHAKFRRQQEDNNSKLDAREHEYRSKLDELKHGNETVSSTINWQFGRRQQRKPSQILGKRS